MDAIFGWVLLALLVGALIGKFLLAAWREIPGRHLTPGGLFKSDKYDWCPEGFFALKVTDRKVWQPILHYAKNTTDFALRQDLIEAVQKAVREAEIVCCEFYDDSQPPGIATSICWFCGDSICPVCEPIIPTTTIHTDCEAGC